MGDSLALGQSTSLRTTVLLHQYNTNIIFNNIGLCGCLNKNFIITITVRTPTP